MSDDFGRAFVDTNILVYAVTADDAQRSPIARSLVRELMLRESLCLSAQVLQELFVTLTRKIKVPFTAAETLRYLDGLSACHFTLMDYSGIREAVQLAGAKMLSFWDSLIVVAAHRSGAKRLYTEDLQHGQKVLGIEIVNPFRTGSD
jgi:predicted nucleic acid-binding protein